MQFSFSLPFNWLLRYKLCSFCFYNKICFQNVVQIDINGVLGKWFVHHEVKNDGQTQLPVASQMFLMGPSTTDDFFTISIIDDMTLGYETNSYNPQNQQWTKQSMTASPVDLNTLHIFNVRDGADGGNAAVRFAILYTDYTNYIVFYNENGECAIASRSTNPMPAEIIGQLKNEINQRISIPSYRFRQIYHGQAERDSMRNNINTINAITNNLRGFNNFGNNFPSFGF